MRKILLVGGVVAVLAWSALQLWATRSLSAWHDKLLSADRAALAGLKGVLSDIPAYRLTFLGAKLLSAGDVELATLVLGEATQKDRFYRDAFRYYSYALEASGDKDGAELALRRAKTLDPREGE